MSKVVKKQKGSAGSGKMRCSLDGCRFESGDRRTMLEHLKGKNNLQTFFQIAMCLEMRTEMVKALQGGDMRMAFNLNYIF